MIRLPTKLFFDTRSGGAVCYIIMAVLRFKHDKKIKAFKGGLWEVNFFKKTYRHRILIPRC